MQLWRSQKGTSGFFQNQIFEISRKREKRAVARMPSKVKYTVCPSAVLEFAPLYTAYTEVGKEFYRWHC